MARIVAASTPPYSVLTIPAIPHIERHSYCCSFTASGPLPTLDETVITVLPRIPSQAASAMFTISRTDTK